MPETILLKELMWEHGEEHTQLTQELTNIFVQQTS